MPGHRGFWGDCQIHATMREAPSHLFPMSIDSLSFFFFLSCRTDGHTAVHFHLGGLSLWLLFIFFNSFSLSLLKEYF